MNKYLIPAFVWLVVITVLSTLPASALPKFDLVSIDKFEHAAAYCLLAWLLLFGLEKGRPGMAGTRRVWFVFLFAAGYGILMEFIQYAFCPGRFYEYDDMLANAIGATLACFVIPRIPLLSPYRN